MPSAVAPQKTASLQLVGDSLARIKSYDAGITSFISLCEAEALMHAGEIDASPGGAAATLLGGRAVAVKDCIAVAGVPCTIGSAFYRYFMPANDAASVARVRRAGGVIVGKTNMHEFAYGGTTENVHYGYCRNPWDLTRIPGGSSGGSAAAVAAGFCDLALGNDTGASIRMPAALCGISGMRTTQGLIPIEGCYPVSPHLDSVGPMGRSVADLADLLTAVTGVDRDRSDFRKAANERTLSGITIGILETGFLDQAEEPVAAAVREAMVVLETLGARLLSVELAGAQECGDAVAQVIYHDAAALHRERLDTAPTLFGDATRARLLRGFDVTEDEYASCRSQLEEWKRVVGRAFADDCDLFLTPTVPITAPLIAPSEDLVSRGKRLGQCCRMWAGARTPALTVPCGFHNSLPIGLQLAAVWGGEPLLLRAGAAYQAVTDWHQKVPDLVPLPVDPAP